MSYVVFALKWRPQDFTSIVGQEHIVTTLKNALQKNRLAHAYLFAGPRGVGKTSTARILAKAINCVQGPTAEPCGKCPSCLEITQGNSLDVIEIDGASNRGIDEIRTLRESVKFAPVRSRYKVYIIDEVHQITPDGFNALLKTLEEPPDFVKFIFATTQANKVMPTIISRCQRLDFRRLSALEIVGQLEKIVAAEQVEVDKEALIAIAKASDGALRDAESILDELVSFAKGKVSLASVVSVLGLVEQEMLFAITDKIVSHDARGALEILDGIINQGKDTGIFLNNLIEHFRNLMVAKVSHGDARLIDLPEEVCKQILKQADLFTMEEIFSAFNILMNAQEIAKRLDSVRIPLEVTLVKLAHDKKGEASQPKHHVKHEHTPHEAPPAPKEAPAVKPPVYREKSVTLPEPKQEEEKEGPEASAQISLEGVKASWQGIVETLSKAKISAGTYLNEGVPVKIDRSVLTVSFPMNLSLHKEALERKENRALVEQVIEQVLKTGLRVNFILSKVEAPAPDTTASPFIKSVLESFGGRVIAED
ncbi:MAG: DNA polymerase III subunit gamma/tau [Candidatus Omnitrophica bacterium]|nr:DNA polymerase III subunit gamma/tau [Candidatus Omnitrophota bacterium]